MRRYRSIKKNSGVKFLGFVGIMLGAVICGYLTARFVVAPLLGYETEVLKLDFPSKLTSLAGDSDESEGENGDAEDADSASDTDDADSAAETADGYALQFGLFTSKAGAEELVNKLQKDGIETKIKEVDGKYKVLSDTYETKAAALEKLEALKDEKNIDVFITVMN